MNKADLRYLLEEIKGELINLCGDNEIIAHAIEDYMDEVINDNK